LKYLFYIRAAVKKGFQYPVNYWTMLVATLVQVAVQWALWNAVYRSRDTIAGITLSSMLTYALVGRAVSGFLNPGPSANIGRKVRSGAIIHDLVKPIGLYAQIFFQNLGECLFNLLFVGCPLILGFVFLGYVRVPDSGTLALFALSLMMGHITLFATVFACNVITFYIKSEAGIYEIYTVLLLLSGAVVPLDFFPKWVRRISRWMPFEKTFYVPMGIFSGMIPQGEVLGALLIQVVWTGLMVLASGVFWRGAVRSLTIHGG